MKIGIDIDDTLVDTKSLQIKLWEEYVSLFPNSLYDKNIPDNINRFGDKYIDNYWDRYREVLMFPEFFEYTSLVTNKLLEDNNLIYIITSRPDIKYKDLLIRLSNWFKDNKIGYSYIITSIKDKGLYCKDNNIDLLIDDDIMHINRAKELGVNTIWYHDTNWLDVYKRVKKNNFN